MDTIFEATDGNTVDCAYCGTVVIGDPTRFGITHAEFICPSCAHTWIGTIDASWEDVIEGRR